MRYTKEFKLECIRKYLNGEYIENPEGCKHKTFQDKVMQWARIYKQLGEAGLDHKKPSLTLEDKLELICRIENGESISSVAFSVGRPEPFIAKLYKLYLQSGMEGLQSHHKKGRPPKMKKEEQQTDIESLDLKEQNKILRQQLLEAQVENEYLKKLAALVQKRKAQQRKKK